MFRDRVVRRVVLRGFLGGGVMSDIQFINTMTAVSFVIGCAIGWFFGTYMREDK